MAGNPYTTLTLVCAGVLFEFAASTVLSSGSVAAGPASGGTSLDVRFTNPGAPPCYTDFMVLARARLHSPVLNIVPAPAGAARRTLLWCACCGRHAKQCPSNLDLSIYAGNNSLQYWCIVNGQRISGLLQERAPTLHSTINRQANVMCARIF